MIYHVNAVMQFAFNDCDFPVRSNVYYISDLKHATMILHCKMRSDISRDASILCNPLAPVFIFPTGPWFCATLCWHRCHVWSMQVSYSWNWCPSGSWKELESLQSIACLACFGSFNGLKSDDMKNIKTKLRIWLLFSLTKCFLCGILGIVELFPGILSKWVQEI